jgi:large subunit ribosomal protein L1
MPKHGKRMKALIEGNDIQAYDVESAVEKVRAMATAKFDETIEAAFRLGVDPRKADQMVRGAVVLPHGTGKEMRVVVFTRGDEAKEAEEAGADHIGFLDLIEKVKEGWMDFDAVVATPDAMSEVAKLGRILGPRGLMPSPKTGTVTKDVGAVVTQLKKGRIEFKVDKTGNVHAPIGKKSFDSDKLRDNLVALIEEIQRLKPGGLKGTYVRGLYLSPSMGPSVRVNVSTMLSRAKE